MTAPGSTDHDARDAGARDRERTGDETGEVCAFCGADRLVWRGCKLICASCRNINKSCGDL